MNRILTIALIILPLTSAGGILFGGGLYVGVREARFLRTASPATGIVTKITEYKSSKSTNYYPNVRFQTPGGEALTFRATGLVGGYAVGDQVGVLYDPDNPSRASIDSFGSLWGVPLLMVTVGTAALVVGGRMAYRCLKGRRTL